MREGSKRVPRTSDHHLGQGAAVPGQVGDFPRVPAKCPALLGAHALLPRYVRSQLGQAGPHISSGAHLVVRQGARNSERAFLPMIPPRMVSGIVTNALHALPTFGGHEPP